MSTTDQEKLKIVELLLKEGKSLSHISEMYGGYDIGNLKYLINLYKSQGKCIGLILDIKPFLILGRKMLKTFIKTQKY